MDPWYDFLAVPVAPLVLRAQLAALGLRSRPLRRAISAAGLTSIAVMLLFVMTLPIAKGMEHDPNIGAGPLMLMLVASLALLIAAWPGPFDDIVSWRPVWR
jgi:peptidoglycan/LPS O-acetylase OafA/YrhL